MSTLDIILIVAAVLLGVAYFARRRARIQRESRNRGQGFRRTG